VNDVWQVVIKGMFYGFMLIIESAFKHYFIGFALAAEKRA
jgi:hypothetical protein